MRRLNLLLICLMATFAAAGCGLQRTRHHLAVFPSHKPDSFLVLFDYKLYEPTAAGLGESLFYEDLGEIAPAAGSKYWAIQEPGNLIMLDGNFAFQKDYRIKATDLTSSPSGKFAAIDTYYDERQTIFGDTHPYGAKVSVVDESGKVSPVSLPELAHVQSISFLSDRVSIWELRPQMVDRYTFWRCELTNGIWIAKKDFEGPYYSLHCLSDGSFLAVEEGDSGVCKFNRKMGSSERTQKYSQGDYIADLCPDLAEKTLLVVCNLERDELKCFDLQSGKELWRLNLAGK